MKKPLNHSRYIDNGAKDIADGIYHQHRTTPTAKQIKFYKKLYSLCKENDIDPTTKHERTRMGFAMAIDTLLERLRENGIAVSSNDKKAEYVLVIGEDRRRRFYTSECILLKDGGTNDTETNSCAD